MQLRHSAVQATIWFGLRRTWVGALEKADVAQTPFKGANFGSHPTFEELMRLSIPHILKDLY
jgi:hypothetical protein